MASVTLKHMKKIYPHAQKKKKQREPVKRSNLKITDEGVVAVEDFSLDIADKEFIVFAPLQVSVWSRPPLLPLLMPFIHLGFYVLKYPDFDPA